MKLLVTLFALFWVNFTSLNADFLMPDEAFAPSAKQLDHDTFIIDIHLGDQIYLYNETLKVVLKDSDGLVISSKTQNDAIDHDGELVYFKTPNISIDIAKLTKNIKNSDFSIELSFQGCSEQGLCYEPMTKVYNFNVDHEKLNIHNSATSNTTAPLTESTGNTEKLSETDSIADSIKSGNIFIILISFFGFGLLLSLTPCIFPLIPILSSVIVAQGSNMSTKRAFSLSLVYVLAMSIAYTMAGVLAGLFGSNLQAAFQAPAVIFSFSAIFVVLSLSMFGVYELQMPNALQSRLTKAGESKSGLVGIAFMGFFSALIVGPCVAAPLAGALIYIGQTGDALLGGMALFALSMGMGMPLLLIGTTAGKFMPKPGAWMDTIKSIFGVMLLGVSIWMVSRIIPAELTMLLFSLLLIVPAVQLGALDVMKNAYKKSIAIIMLLVGLSWFIGALSGATSMLKPFEKFTSSMITTSTNKAQNTNSLQFKKITSVEELDTILKNSKGKKVLVDFYADWCTSCKELEHITFADENVARKMSEFILVQADVTANGEKEKELSKKFGVFGPPVILFFNEKSEFLKASTIVGYKGPEDFLSQLNEVK
jgi:thiol:disulfide interchange protein DsbD